MPGQNIINFVYQNVTAKSSTVIRYPLFNITSALNHEYFNAEKSIGSHVKNYSCRFSLKLAAVPLKICTVRSRFSFCLSFLVLLQIHGISCEPVSESTTNPANHHQLLTTRHQSLPLQRQPYGSAWSLAIMIQLSASVSRRRQLVLLTWHLWWSQVELPVHRHHWVEHRDSIIASRYSSTCLHLLVAVHRPGQIC